MKTQRKVKLIAASALVSLAQLASAGTATSADLLNDETQIINTGGTVISAYNFGTADVTINGIFHTGGTSPAFSPNFQGAFRNAGRAGYTDPEMVILMNGIAGRNGAELDMAITGLTVGVEYLFQGYWEGRDTGQTLGVTFEGVDTAPSVVGPTGDGNFGDIISYQFVATDDTLNVDWDKIAGGGNVWINGYSLQAIPKPSSPVSLSDFTYNPADGSSSVSIKGAPDTRYQLAEADDLDFSNPDQNPIPLDGATVGVLDGDVVTTDGNGDATVQFNLGTTKPATFIRAENLPPPPPLIDENFDAAAALPADWASSGPNNGTDWEVGVPSGVISGPLAPVSEPNCAGTNIGGYYTENTDVTLTSPSIPIPVAASATLTFKQLIDTDAAGDSGSVRILDADNSDAPIANLEITGLQGEGSSGDGWTTGTLALPALEVGGKNIKVQFRFVSDAGSIQDTDVFGGFYIDDVLLALD